MKFGGKFDKLILTLQIESLNELSECQTESRANFENFLGTFETDFILKINF